MVLATTMAATLQEYWAKVATPIGVIGVTGQLVFTGRMVVQWWASEKQGASVVPKLFWHMSLWGAAMVLAYGLDKRDPVIVLGQAFSFVVYARNLVLLSRTGSAVSRPAGKFGNRSDT